MSQMEQRLTQQQQDAQVLVRNAAQAACDQGAAAAARSMPAEETTPADCEMLAAYGESHISMFPQPTFSFKGDLMTTAQPSLLAPTPVMMGRAAVQEPLGMNLGSQKTKEELPAATPTSMPAALGVRRAITQGKRT